MKPNNFLKIILESYWHKWFTSAEWKPLRLRWQTWGRLVVMLLSWDEGAWAHIHPWAGHEKWFKAKLSYPEVRSHRSPRCREGLQWRHNCFDISPHRKFPMKSIPQINPVLRRPKLHFSAKKIFIPIQRRIKPFSGSFFPQTERGYNSEISLKHTDTDLFRDSASNTKHI